MYFTSYLLVWEYLSKTNKECHGRLKKNTDVVCIRFNKQLMSSIGHITSIFINDTWMKQWILFNKIFIKAGYLFSQRGIKIGLNCWICIIQFFILRTFSKWKQRFVLITRKREKINVYCLLLQSTFLAW